MSHLEPEPTDGHRESPAAAAEELYTRVFGELVERIAPWFFDFGSWVFGGLIGFNLLLLGPLITVGPVDPAVLVATAAFALALPLDVAGVFVLRLVQDLQRVGLEDEVARALGEVGAVEGSSAVGAVEGSSAVGAVVPPPDVREAQRRRRTERVLRASIGLLALSGVLAVLGMLGMLWHMGWWIAVAFAAMVVISLVIASVAMAAAQPRDAAEARERRRRYQEQGRRARDARRGQAHVPAQAPAQAPARDGKRDERT
jgi:hypothetical protein